MLQSIHSTPASLTLAELLALYAAPPCRTAQRWLAQAVADRRIVELGAARARRCLPTAARPLVAPPSGHAEKGDGFPAAIPLSADSRDVLAYVHQLLADCKLVPAPDRWAVQAAIVGELHRLHEGRTGSLRPAAIGIRCVEGAGSGLIAFLTALCF